MKRIKKSIHTCINLEDLYSNFNTSFQSEIQSLRFHPGALMCQQNLKSANIVVSRPLNDDDIQIRFCQSSKDESKKKENKLSPQKLQEIQDILNKVTIDIFTSVSLPLELIHDDIILWDRVSQKNIYKKPYYIVRTQQVKLYGHIRYSFVACKIISSTINPDKQTVEIHFKFLGIGPIEFWVHFFPKKLMKKENLIPNSNTWLEAKSTFFIDNDGLIFKHVIDNREIDQDKIVKSPVEKIKEQIIKKTNPNLA